MVKKEPDLFTITRSSFLILSDAARKMIVTRDGGDSFFFYSMKSKESGLDVFQLKDALIFAGCDFEQARHKAWVTLKRM